MQYEFYDRITGNKVIKDNGMKSPQALEANKNVVNNFQQLCFGDGKPAEAVALYLAPHYLLHNPDVEDGAEAITRYFENYISAFPKPLSTCVRIEAQNDFVVLRIHLKKENGAEDVHVSIFRIESDKIAEHWEVIKPPSKKTGTGKQENETV